MKSFLYLSAGENETDDIKGGLDAMAAALRTGAPAGLEWHVERTPGVDHSLNAQESGWSALKKWGAFARSKGTFSSSTLSADVNSVAFQVR